jgi:hypothetical protein
LIVFGYFERFKQIKTMKIYIILHGGFYDGYSIYPKYFTALEAAEKKAVWMVQEYNESMSKERLMKKDKGDVFSYSNSADFLSIMEMEDESEAK